jgi:hypothetical protein
MLLEIPDDLPGDHLMLLLGFQQLIKVGIILHLCHCGKQKCLRIGRAKVLTTLNAANSRGTGPGVAISGAFLFAYGADTIGKFDLPGINKSILIKGVFCNIFFDFIVNHVVCVLRLSSV